MDAFESSTAAPSKRFCILSRRLGRSWGRLRHPSWREGAGRVPAWSGTFVWQTGHPTDGGTVASRLVLAKRWVPSLPAAGAVAAGRGGSGSLVAPEPASSQGTQCIYWCMGSALGLAMLPPPRVTGCPGICHPWEGAAPRRFLPQQSERLGVAVRRPGISSWKCSSS